jgi:hypothetical protein
MRRFHLTYRQKTSSDSCHWVIIEENATEVSATYRTKREGLEHAKEIVSAAKGSLLIHKMNGQIQEERTYGVDPPTKG